MRDTVRELDFEVIVVDNHSADAPRPTLIEQFPWITLPSWNSPERGLPRDGARRSVSFGYAPALPISETGC